MGNPRPSSTPRTVDHSSPAPSTSETSSEGPRGYVHRDGTVSTSYPGGTGHESLPGRRVTQKTRAPGTTGPESTSPSEEERMGVSSLVGARFGTYGSSPK